MSARIRRQMVQTISRYHLLAEGDRVMVCVSGGKDSAIMLALLSDIQKRAPFGFEIGAVILDQKQPGFRADVFAGWLRDQLGIELSVIEKDTYSIVKEKTRDRVFCSLCSRLRRGILYEHAVRHGFNKMALGHHRDDSAETLLLNLFYSGKMQAMPPKFRSDDGRNVVIRPLLGVAEADLRELASEWQIPVIPCNLCGSQEGLKRQKIKSLLTELESTIPFIRNSMATAIANVRTSHLADDAIWDFRNLPAENHNPSLEDAFEA